MKNVIRVTAMALLFVMCACLFVSCVPATDPEKAVAALKDADYTAANTKIGSIGALLVPDGVENVVTGAKKDSAVTIYYFDESKNAKAYWDEKKDDLKEDYESAGIFGKVVYFGDKDAVNAAR